MIARFLWLCLQPPLDTLLKFMTFSWLSSTFSYLVFTLVPTTISLPPWGNGLCLGKWYHWSYFESHFLRLELSVIWEWMLLHWYIMPYGQSICILTGAFWMPGSIEETCNPDITRKGVVREHFPLRPYHSGRVCSSLFPKSSHCFYYSI